MLCGKPVVEDTGRFFKVISRIEENGEEFDESELAHLPSKLSPWEIILSY